MLTGQSEVRPNDGMRLTFLRVRPAAELNVFEIDGNDEAARRRISLLAQFGPRRPRRTRVSCAVVVDENAVNTLMGAYAVAVDRRGVAAWPS